MIDSTIEPIDGTFEPGAGLSELRRSLLKDSATQEEADNRLRAIIYGKNTA